VTPREQVARAICAAHDTGAGWEDWPADRQQLYLSMADAAIGAMSSLPVGGGDGRNPYPWLLFNDDGSASFDLRGTTPAEADRRLTIVQELRSGNVQLPGSPVSSPAGDEAREALERALPRDLFEAGARRFARERPDSPKAFYQLREGARWSWIKGAYDEIREAALASQSSPLPGADDVKYQWAIFDKDDEPVCTSLGPDDHVLRAERWDEWMPERAPHRLRGRTCTTSAWFDAPAPAPADDKEATR